MGILYVGVVLYKGFDLWLAWRLRQLNKSKLGERVGLGIVTFKKILVHVNCFKFHIGLN